MKTLISKPAARFARYSDVPNSYPALCGIYLPRPIHNPSEQRAASVLVEALAGFPLNSEQEDYLEAVAHFVDEYDRTHAKPLPTAGHLAVLRHLLAEHGLAAADLARLLGASRNLGAMILRGERNLTLAHVRKLAAHFQVSPQVFL